MGSSIVSWHEFRAARSELAEAGLSPTGDDLLRDGRYAMHSLPAEDNEDRRTR